MYADETRLFPVSFYPRLSACIPVPHAVILNVVADTFRLRPLQLLALGRIGVGGDGIDDRGRYALEEIGLAERGADLLPVGLGRVGLEAGADVAAAGIDVDHLHRALAGEVRPLQVEGAGLRIGRGAEGDPEVRDVVHDAPPGPVPLGHLLQDVEGVLDRRLYGLRVKGAGRVGRPDEPGHRHQGIRGRQLFALPVAEGGGVGAVGQRPDRQGVAGVDHPRAADEFDHGAGAAPVAHQQMGHGAFPGGRDADERIAGDHLLHGGETVQEILPVLRLADVGAAVRHRIRPFRDRHDLHHQPRLVDPPLREFAAILVEGDAAVLRLPRRRRAGLVLHRHGRFHEAALVDDHNAIAERPVVVSAEDIDVAALQVERGTCRRRAE